MANTGVKVKYYEWVVSFEGRTTKLSNDACFGRSHNVKRGEVRKPIGVAGVTEQCGLTKFYLKSDAAKNG